MCMYTNAVFETSRLVPAPACDARWQVEGNVAWLLEQFRVCFMGNPGVEPLGETLTSGTVYNPGVMGGTLASMQRLVRRIMEVLDMVGFDISQGYAG